MDQETLVYLDLDGAPHLVGRLWARVRKNKESASFEYDIRGWTIPPGSLSSRPCSLVQARFTPWRIRRYSAPLATRPGTGGGGRSCAGLKEGAQSARGPCRAPCRRLTSFYYWRTKPARVRFALPNARVDYSCERRGSSISRRWSSCRGCFPRPSGREGWRLSPAYDLNPVPVDIRPRILTMAINEDGQHGVTGIGDERCRLFRSG